MNLIELLIVAACERMHREVPLTPGPVLTAVWKIQVWGHRQLNEYPDLAPLIAALKEKKS